MDFVIPTRIILGKNKKKSFPINVNSFANQHHRVKHNAKMVFYDYIESLELKKKYGTFDHRVQLHYKYYAERGGLFDEANVGGGIDKFTADALVSCGVLRDDNYQCLKHYTFEFCGIKKDHDWHRPDIKGYCGVYILKA